MRLPIKIAVIITGIILLAAVAAGVYLFNMKHADLTRVKPDFVISATDLQKEFDADEKAASAKYTGKVIEVSGKIASVKPAENNVLNITLHTGSELSSVICTCPATNAQPALSADSFITLRGECSGFLMDVLLNNCSIINTKSSGK